MPVRPSRRPSAAVVLATLALVVAAGPPTYAAARTLAAGSVGTAQLKNGAVTTSKIRSSAVTSSRVKDGTLTRSDLATSARAQRVVVGSIESNNCCQNTIPADGVIASLSSGYGSGLLRMPAAGRIMVDGYVILNNTNSAIRASHCDVLVDGQDVGRSGIIYMQGTYSTSFTVQAVDTVAAGSHDVAIQCDGTSATWINLGVTVLGIAS